MKFPTPSKGNWLMSKGIWHEKASTLTVAPILESTKTVWALMSWKYTNMMQDIKGSMDRIFLSALSTYTKKTSFKEN